MFLEIRWRIPTPHRRCPSASLPLRLSLSLHREMRYWLSLKRRLSGRRGSRSTCKYHSLSASLEGTTHICKRHDGKLQCHKWETPAARLIFKYLCAHSIYSWCFCVYLLYFVNCFIYFPAISRVNCTGTYITLFHCNHHIWMEISSTRPAENQLIC